MTSKLFTLAFVLFMFLLSSCGGGNLVGEINESTRVTDGIVPAGETLVIRNGAEIIVQGELVVNGIIVAENGPINIVIEEGGHLVINGDLSAVTNGEDAGSDFRSGGIYILAQGDLEFSSTARVQTNGLVIITDDPAELTRDPDEITAETDSASGDLATIVPLPPDDPAFEEGDSSLPRNRANTFRPVVQDLPTVIISGDWDVGGFPGDQQVILFSFSFPAKLVLRDIEVTGPPAPNGESESVNSDEAESGDAKGGNGKKGLRLNIRNPQGSVEIENAIFNLTDGGNGGEAVALCGKAEGGKGGESGNMRVTAGIGISVRSVIINPGLAGNGGYAQAHCEKPGGDASEAIGGQGADNNKRLFVRGNVTIEDLTIGTVFAGNGGQADAYGGDGEEGEECESGGEGGDAYAEGGDGGSASLNVSGLPVVVGGVIGGDGGHATAYGGNGGNGGPCLCETTEGGAGGTAVAIPGSGGSASGGNPNTDGDDGQAEEVDGLDGTGTKDECASAIEAYEAGDWVLALELFDRAVENHPDEAGVVHRRGVLLYEMGRFEEALNDFRRALELNPNSEQAYYGVGISLYQLGQYAEAHEAFREATHINPDYDMAWYGRALAEDQLGLADDALDSYLTFLELHPDDDEFRAYANQRVAALRGGGGSESSGGITVSGSYAHTQPGVQSEVYLDILGPAGSVAQFTLSGPGILGSSSQSGTIGDNGRLRLTWVINQFGKYTASGTVNGQTFNITINVQ